MRGHMEFVKGAVRHCYQPQTCEYERVDKALCFSESFIFLIINISCSNLLVIRI